MIYLLDLNYTIVGNSTVKRRPFLRQIEIEEYRLDLVDALKDARVYLITARPEKYQDVTLASIKDKTGWLPEKAYFNAFGLRPPLAKQRWLKETILPENPGEAFFGIESNPATRAMYARHGIASQRYEDFIHAGAETMDV